MKVFKLLLPFLLFYSTALAQTTPWSSSPAITGQTRTLSGSTQIRWIWGSSNIYSLPDSIAKVANFTYSKPHIDSLVNAASTKAYVLTVTPGINTITDSRLINANVIHAFRSGYLFVPTGGTLSGNSYSVNATSGTLTFANNFTAYDTVVADCNSSITIGGITGPYMEVASYSAITFPAFGWIYVDSDSANNNGAPSLYFAKEGTTSSTTLQWVISLTSNK